MKIEKEIKITKSLQTIEISHSENMVLTIDTSIIRDVPKYAIWIQISTGQFQFAVGRKPSKNSRVHGEGYVHELFIVERKKGLKRQSQAEILNFRALPGGGRFRIDLYGEKNENIKG